MSCFSFLQRRVLPAGAGRRRPMSWAARASAIADRNTLAGVVRAHAELKTLKAELKARSPAEETDFKLIIGARLVFAWRRARRPGLSPATARAMARLCRLLDPGRHARRRQEGRLHHPSLDDLLAGTRRAAVLGGGPAGAAVTRAAWRREAGAPGSGGAGPGLAGGAGSDYGPIERGPAGDPGRAWRRRPSVPCWPVNDVLYHAPGAAAAAGRDGLHPRARAPCRRPGGKLEANPERHLKPPAEMARLFKRSARGRRPRPCGWPRCCDFSLDELKYEYPGRADPARQDPATAPGGSDLGRAPSAIRKAFPKRFRTNDPRGVHASSPRWITPATS